MWECGGGPHRHGMGGGGSSASNTDGEQHWTDPSIRANEHRPHGRIGATRMAAGPSECRLLRYRPDVIVRAGAERSRGRGLPLGRETVTGYAFREWSVR